MSDPSEVSRVKIEEHRRNFTHQTLLGLYTALGISQGDNVYDANGYKSLSGRERQERLERSLYYAAREGFSGPELERAELFLNGIYLPGSRDWTLPTTLELMTEVAKGEFSGNLHWIYGVGVSHDGPNPSSVGMVLPGINLARYMRGLIPEDCVRGELLYYRNAAYYANYEGDEYFSQIADLTLNVERSLIQNYIKWQRGEEGLNYIETFDTDWHDERYSEFLDYYTRELLGIYALKSNIMTDSGSSEYHLTNQGHHIVYHPESAEYSLINAIDRIIEFGLKKVGNIRGSRQNLEELTREQREAIVEKSIRYAVGGAIHLKYVSFTPTGNDVFINYIHHAAEPFRIIWDWIRTEEIHATQHHIDRQKMREIIERGDEEELKEMNVPGMGFGLFIPRKITIETPIGRVKPPYFRDTRRMPPVHWWETGEDRILNYYTQIQRFEDEQPKTRNARIKESLLLLGLFDMLKGRKNIKSLLKDPNLQTFLEEFAQRFWDNVMQPTIDGNADAISQFEGLVSRREHERSEY